MILSARRRVALVKNILCFVCKIKATIRCKKAIYYKWVKKRKISNSQDKLQSVENGEGKQKTSGKQNA